MPRLREAARGIGQSLAAVLLFVAFCELVVFRLLWPGSDVPADAFVGGVIRYAPHQSGVWRVRNEIAAPYRINAQGWNSGVGDYQVARRAGVPRIAIVGDSFVEALQVPYDRSFGERLAADVGAAATPAEVYRFAIGGAPLSQFSHMIEHEVAQYRPDWIVVLIAHNDFAPSYMTQAGRYASSFLKLRVDDGRVVGEIPPSPWRESPLDVLRQTATARFFLYRWQLRPEILTRWLLPTAQAAMPKPGAPEAESDVVAAVTDYLFARIAAQAHNSGARLLIAMDGDRFAIYQGRSDSEALELNRMAAATAARHGIAFIDLQPVFAADWATAQRRFDFDADAHWNEYGHAVAGTAIARELRRLWPQTASAP